MESKLRRKSGYGYPTLTKISRNASEIMDGIVVRDLRPLLIWSDGQQVWGPGPPVSGLTDNVDGTTYLELVERARHDVDEIDNLAEWIGRQPKEARPGLYSYAVLEFSVLAAIDVMLDKWEKAVRILVGLENPCVSRDEVVRRWDRYVTSIAGLIVETFFGFDPCDEIMQRLERTLQKSLLMYLVRNPGWEQMAKRRIISTLRSEYRKAVMQEAQSLAEVIPPLNEIYQEYRELLPCFDPHQELVSWVDRQAGKRKLGKSAADLGISVSEIYNRRHVKRGRAI